VVEAVDDGGETRYRFATPPQSIGTMSAGHGNFGVLVRAYTFIRALGAEGIRQASGDAVLNANYLRRKLEHIYRVAVDRTCMHEVVFSCRPQRDKGVKALDISKRMIDYGVHPPTMYFPLIVDEALMVEPTETESKETLDEFIEAMNAIDREATENPELVQNAPHTLPVRRLNEAQAARRPDLRWERKE
jgi:glycine dehydrogenase subunit 2